MPILVATDREVVVIDSQHGTSAPTHGVGHRPTCLAADPLFRGVRGVARTEAACSSATMAEGPGGRSASRAG